MKRPCPYCRQEVDDGLPCPVGISPENLRLSHKVCKDCEPKLVADIEAQIKHEQIRQLNKRLEKENK